jgi:hypothetical protein
MVDFQKAYGVGISVPGPLFPSGRWLSPFGLEAPGDKVQFDITTASLSACCCSSRFLGGFYVGIPMVSAFFPFSCWFVLFILVVCGPVHGALPRSFHSLNVGTHPLGTRVQTYMNMMTVKYPPFGAE